MMKKFGISYTSAGENIAQGQRTPEEVVQAWMNSAGHRANILNNGFTHIGVGYVESGNYWTQQFITKILKESSHNEKTLFTFHNFLLCMSIKRRT